ncbi:hypothetical protein [Roseovarius amoyensis]|uniref:hypothetical protein n=1 Tax=Roseovarius amoyensis TaxID=2211448 RepID=UPI0013A6F7FC|nr:hypothetical protein [Roseovarius amoyensis]
MYKRQYQTARSLFGFMAFEGWAVVVAGAIISTYGLVHLARPREAMVFFCWYRLPPEFPGSFSGWF